MHPERCTDARVDFGGKHVNAKLVMFENIRAPLLSTGILKKYQTLSGLIQAMSV